MKKPIALLLFLLLWGNAVYSQVSVNTTGSPPHSSAMLDVSSVSKGLLLPRMTAAQMQAIANPATGLLLYNTDNQSLYNFNGASWNMIKAHTPSRIQDEEGNTAVDTEFEWNNNEIHFILNGYTKMILNQTGLGVMDPSNNIYIGQFSGLFSSPSNSNIAIGESALSFNDGGNYSVAIGRRALQINNYSEHNTAVGYMALNINANHNNTAVGSQALKNNNSGGSNTATGAYALTASQNGSNNTANGYHAAYVTTSGFNNVAVGANSLVNNTTGSYHTSVGYNTGPNSANLANTTCIGIDATATATDMVRIGNVYVNSIGGQVGWSTLSDGRFKENVSEDVPGLNFINRLRPVTYQVNREKINDFTGISQRYANDQSGTPRYTGKELLSPPTTGFIAQEVEASAKELGFDFSGVDAPDNANDYYGLRYAEFVVPLVKAVQELTARTEEQQKTINELIAKISELQARDQVSGEDQ